jgi:hypothetical protein
MLKLVMPGFVPGIYDLAAVADGKTWMAGTGPAMTVKLSTLRTYAGN